MSGVIKGFLTEEQEAAAFEKGFKIGFEEGIERSIVLLYKATQDIEYVTAVYGEVGYARDKILEVLQRHEML